MNVSSRLRRALSGGLFSLSQGSSRSNNSFTPRFVGALVVAALMTGGCRQEVSRPPKVGAELKIFCAASLGAVANEVCEKEAIPVALNVGGSNALVRQASLGAAVDLLLLADDEMAREILVPKGYSLTTLASNELVLVAPRRALQQAPRDFAGAMKTAGGKIAIADPQTAPLGKYTKQALGKIETSAELVPMQDAQAVLTAVSLGHANLGIVYATDALSESTVQVVATVPENTHSPVMYVGAVPPNARPESLRLLESLKTGAGEAVLGKAGFLPLARKEPSVSPTPPR